MLSRNVLYYGKDEALPEHTVLRAGPLQMIYDGGALRYIKYGSVEVLRRIYVAIRDRNWGTVLPVFSNVRVAAGEDSFRISFAVENKQGDIDFAWQGMIAGEADGTVTFFMDGEARATFLKNRIGFCVLHPASCAGAPCGVEHVDGTRDEAEFPYFIVARQPVLPFADMRALSHQIEPGKWAEVRFDGDVFEMEDQRNWTDASYKTFCTPLCIPYPAEIKQGTRVRQSIRISLHSSETAGQPARAAAAGKITALKIADLKSPNLMVNVDLEQPGQVLPAVGLGMASHALPLSDREVARLKALHLQHLRVDLDLQKTSFPNQLARATDQARVLGVQLEAALLIDPAAPQAVEHLARIVEQTRPPIAAWLIYPANEKFLGGSPVMECVQLAHRALDGKAPQAKFAAGTNTDFIFMQRSLPPFDQIDEITFAITPQVHAFDNASLVETLEAQPQAVASARRLAEGLPVRVSPVTFKMRFNPYATGPAPALKPGELPPQVDVRQMSLFGAGWTLGCLSALTGSGVSSLTFFETTGWLGVMEAASGSPIPGVFQSIPGGVYPLYFVFNALGEFVGGEVTTVKSSDGMAISAMLLRRGNRKRLMLANHTDQAQRVNLPGLPAVILCHILDETNVEMAMGSPEEFLAQSGKTFAGHVDPLKLELKPYAFGWFDL